MTAVNQVKQYVDMLMNILPAHMEIFVAVIMTMRDSKMQIMTK
jgi:hypothetical protein